MLISCKFEIKIPPFYRLLYFSGRFIGTGFPQFLAYNTLHFLNFLCNKNFTFDSSFSSLENSKENGQIRIFLKCIFVPLLCFITKILKSVEKNTIFLQNRHALLIMAKIQLKFNLKLSPFNTVSIHVLCRH